MRKLFNISTYAEDLERYPTPGSFDDLCTGFDGVELLCGGDDPLSTVPKEKIIGAHSVFFNYWYDFRKGDTDGLIWNLGSEENIRKYYGAYDSGILVETLRKSIIQAEELGAEYIVVHIADCGLEEAWTRSFIHSEKEIADEMCDIIHEACEGIEHPKILCENLWVPGMTMLSTEITERVLDALSDLDAGIMLDTGHLMNTDMSIRNIDDACDRIEKILDLNRRYLDRICGVHLSSSLSGEYAKAHMTGVFDPAMTFEEKNIALFEYISNLDQHLPFRSERVNGILEKIGPDYVTFEFITRSGDELKAKLREQLKWLYI